MDKLGVIVLAGGKGTRMKSRLGKVLVKLWAKPLIFWTLDLLRKLGLLERAVVVTGYRAEIVEKAVKDAGYKVSFARQRSQLGTAHATGVGLKGLTKIDRYCRDILVLFGDDSSLYKPGTIRKFIEFHDKRNSVITLLTAKKNKITSLGGLKRVDGKVVGVLDPDTMKRMEVKEHEIVCGAFLFDRKWLSENLKNAPRSKKSGEYVLPGLIGVAASQGSYPMTYTLSDPREWTSINTPEELKLAQRKKDARNGN